MSTGRSYEIRWFFHGRVPDGVQRWWDDLDGDRVDALERTDVYLVVPDRPDLGSKIREGRLELKTRESRDPAVPLGDRHWGASERWLKERWQLAGVFADAGDVTASGARVRISKRRSQRKFHSTGTGYRAIEKDDIGELVVNFAHFNHPAFAAELTRISSSHADDIGAYDADQDGWTLAFEAFGEQYSNDARRATAVLGAAWLLRTYPEPGLAASASYGYPEFVLRRSIGHGDKVAAIGGTDHNYNHVNGRFRVESRSHKETS